MHHQIASQKQVGDDLPCADTKLLAPLKRSAEYRTVHPRLADIHPLDNWQQDGLHYFVFPLKAADGTLVAAEDAPVVVFTMHPESVPPISVVVVTPSENGGDAEVVNLRQPGSGYTVPLSPWGVQPEPPSPVDITPTPLETARGAGTNLLASGAGRTLAQPAELAAG